MTSKPVAHLSRNEVTHLVFDKLQLIVEEATTAQHENWTKSSMADAKARVKRIAVEARRAAALLETYESVAKAGHCLYCGKTYAEHDESQLPRGARLNEELMPRCSGLRKLFDSLEIETYQSFVLETPASEGQ